MPVVTNGRITYNRRFRTGDFEHRDALVELSFTIGEGEDVAAALASVAEAARSRAEAMVANTPAVGMAPAAPRPAKPPGTVAPETASSAKIKEADKPPAKTEAKEKPAAKGLATSEIEGGPVVPEAKEITDAKLVEHITHANTGGKNTMAIRELIAEFVGPPPGKARDIPQERRAEFISRLPKP